MFIDNRYSFAEFLKDRNLLPTKINSEKDLLPLWEQYDTEYICYCRNCDLAWEIL